MEGRSYARNRRVVFPMVAVVFAERFPDDNSTLAREAFVTLTSIIINLILNIPSHIMYIITFYRLLRRRLLLLFVFIFFCGVFSQRLYIYRGAFHSAQQVASAASNPLETVCFVILFSFSG